MLAHAKRRTADTDERDVASLRLQDGKDALHLACCKDSISSAIVRFDILTTEPHTHTRESMQARA